jgi:hypothetical protein
MCSARLPHSKLRSNGSKRVEPTQGATSPLARLMTPEPGGKFQVMRGPRGDFGGPPLCVRGAAATTAVKRAPNPVAI